jgi:AcrR family transcriptional regulator
MAEKLTSTAKPSRRQDHKMRTKRALQKAALDLFAKDGYDTTTTDEIAERAGVSARTFFRYFPTKDSVLFVGEYGWFQSLTEDFLAQPDSRSDLEALLETLLAEPPGRRSQQLYDKAVASSPTLRGVVHAHQQEDIETLAAAVAARRGLRKADEGCRLLATVVLMTYRRALTRWLAGPASVDARAVITEEFDVLLKQFAPATSKARLSR